MLCQVEKAVSKVDDGGELLCQPLTNSMGVESATDAQIVEAVEQAGYGASQKAQQQNQKMTKRITA